METIAKTYKDLTVKREKLAKENYKRREDARVDALREALPKAETVALLTLLLGEKKCQSLYGRDGGFRELIDYNVANVEFDVRVVEFGREEDYCYPSEEDYAAADKELGIEA